MTENRKPLQVALAVCIARNENHRQQQLQLQQQQQIFMALPILVLQKRINSVLYHMHSEMVKWMNKWREREKTSNSTKSNLRIYFCNKYLKNEKHWMYSNLITLVDIAWDGMEWHEITASDILRPIHLSFSSVFFRLVFRLFCYHDEVNTHFLFASKW